jgi:hypothetical protein
MIKRLGLIFIAILVLSGCAGSNTLNAQDKRNNFDLCKIDFLKQVNEKEYKSHSEFYEKQADEGCSPLLGADATGLEDFRAPKLKSYSASNLGSDNAGKSSNTLTINVKHGPWDISSDETANSAEANRLCKDENFNYPLGERIEIYNEKGVTVGIGKISTFVSASYKSPNVTDYVLTCNYRGTVDVKSSGNFFRIKIAGTFWNDLTSVDELPKSSWVLNLNSDDY